MNKIKLADTLRIVGSLMFLLLSIGCREDVDTSQLANYEGPMRVSYDIELFHSDSAIVRTKLTADKQLQFENEDMEFPEGILIHFFEPDGQLSTTIRADRGYYTRKTNEYKGEGDVRVHNLIKDQKLSSEELFWDPNQKKIHTDKFVTVEERGRIINGTGMEADENFSNYKVFKIVDSRIPLPGEDI